MRKPIFPDVVAPEPKIHQSPFDLKRAQLLKAAIQKHLKAIKPVSTELWAKEFSKLRLIDKISKKEIRETLDWYILNFNKDYIPQAYSASGFRKKYLKIRQAMQRAGDVPVPLSEETILIVNSLLSLTWRNCSKKELAETVQLSLTAYTDFLELRKQGAHSIACGEHKLPGNKLRQFVGFHAQLEYTFHRPTTFVLAWMRHVNDIIESWEDWSGNLKSMAFSVSSKQFQRMGRTWAQDYCADPERWDFYLEALQCRPSA